MPLEQHLEVRVDQEEIMCGLSNGQDVYSPRALDTGRVVETNG